MEVAFSELDKGEGLAEPLFDLGSRSSCTCSSAGGAEVQIMIDDEALARLQVGGELVVVGVFATLLTVARQPRPGMVAIVRSEQSADPGSQRLELSYLSPD